MASVYFTEINHSIVVLARFACAPALVSCGGRTGDSDFPISQAGGSRNTGGNLNNAGSAAFSGEIDGGMPRQCTVEGSQQLCTLSRFRGNQTCSTGVLSPCVPIWDFDGINGCVALSDGTVQCWGGNDCGQLGNGSSVYNSSTAVSVSNLVDVTSIAVGSTNGCQHVCAIVQPGNVYCWGWLWDGNTGPNGDMSVYRTPILVPDLTNAVSIAAGDSHSCALTQTGTVQCWGPDNVGQLGNGDGQSLTGSVVPSTVVTISNATAISASQDLTCAITQPGTVQCWGDADWTPIVTSGLADVVTISSPCALTSQGLFYCWDNLGIATTSIPNMSNIKAISVGYNNSCALTQDALVKCWGSNAVGQLGDGTTTDRSDPVTVVNLSNVTSINVGVGTSCAATIDGNFYCWGDNSSGQLGVDPTLMPESSVPVLISGLGH